jgi:hypothetical protein
VARPSILPTILAVLEPFLERRQQEWAGQVDAARAPTLPEVFGKVDVRNLVKALGLPLSYEQHFYNKSELRTLVNSIAEGQGLKGIGSRAEMDDYGKAAESRLTQAQKERSDFARALSEAHAQIDRLRRENSSLRAQLELRASTGMTLRLPITGEPGKGDGH